MLVMTCLAALSPPARAAGLTVVVCAPGYPGSTAEAQPAMDGLAAAITAAAGWKAGAIDATYFESEKAGVAGLRAPEAGLALVTLPFYLEHRDGLDLRPHLMAVPADREPLESWYLVAGAGLVERPQDIAGWEILSLAGHSPRFVRDTALADWGEVPESVTITFSGAVLSGLRRAAKGEDVALLLDGGQAASIARLPFADRLEVVHQSQQLPISVVCSVGDRIESEKVSRLLTALESLAGDPGAAEALAGVRLTRFVAIDRPTLERAERSFSGAHE
jgi:hypothetical protein